jgi:hypothetical protein
LPLPDDRDVPYLVLKDSLFYGFGETGSTAAIKPGFSGVEREWNKYDCQYFGKNKMPGVSALFPGMNEYSVNNIFTD